MSAVTGRTRSPASTVRWWPRRERRRSRRPARPKTTPRCRSVTTSALSPCPGASTDGSRSTNASAGSPLDRRARRRDRGWPPTASPRVPLLVGSLACSTSGSGGRSPSWPPRQRAPGAPVRRPGRRSALRAIVAGGRDAFYGGAFGEGLLAMGDGHLHGRGRGPRAGRLGRPLTACACSASSCTTIAPNSQGYLALGAARIAERLDAARRPRRCRGGHTCSSRRPAPAGLDRPDVLHEDADGAPLAGRGSRRRPHDRSTSSGRDARPVDGRRRHHLSLHGWTASGWPSSLIQSNAAGFGSLAGRADDRHQPPQPRPRVQPDRRPPGRVPGPGRRPPHTLCPR